MKYKAAGQRNKVIRIRLKEKIPIFDKICKLSIDQAKLYAQRFHGKPVRTKLLKKSNIANKKLIEIKEYIFRSIK